jgi:HAD superfamily phosphatase (TIGR01668 family)
MSLFLPDFYYRDVAAIDLRSLQDRGIRGLAVDLDNTLVPRTDPAVPPSAHRFVARAADSGMGVCLVSNNWHERVRLVSEELSAPFIARALKPMTRAFRQAAGMLDIEPDALAVVGDQVFTDMLGGNLAGAVTVLVQPLSASELPHTVLLRRLEAAIMAGRTPVGDEQSQ